MKGLAKKAKGPLSRYIAVSLSQSAPDEPYSRVGPAAPLSKDK
jgi:hypothetical protein